MKASVPPPKVRIPEPTLTAAVPRTDEEKAREARALAILDAHIELLDDILSDQFWTNLVLGPFGEMITGQGLTAATYNPNPSGTPGGGFILDAATRDQIKTDLINNLLNLLEPDTEQARDYFIRNDTVTYGGSRGKYLSKANLFTRNLDDWLRSTSISQIEATLRSAGLGLPQASEALRLDIIKNELFEDLDLQLQQYRFGGKGIRKQIRLGLNQTFRGTGVQRINSLLDLYLRGRVPVSPDNVLAQIVNSLVTDDPLIRQRYAQFVEERTLQSITQRALNTLDSRMTSAMDYMETLMGKGYSHSQALAKAMQYQTEQFEPGGLVLKPGEVSPFQRTLLNDLAQQVSTDAETEYMKQNPLFFNEDPAIEKFWNTVFPPDEKIRETHKFVFPNPVALDEKFQVGARNMDGPGDPAGFPEEVVNCRCRLSFGGSPPGREPLPPRGFEPPEVGKGFTWGKPGGTVDDFTRFVQGLPQNVKVSDAVRQGYEPAPEQPPGPKVPVQFSDAVRERLNFWDDVLANGFDFDSGGEPIEIPKPLSKWTTNTDN